MIPTQNVEDALKLMDGCISTMPEGNKRDWQTIRAHLLSQDAELKILRVKCSGTLANNLCPDHGDKQVGNPCLACTIEKLQSRLAAANERLEAAERKLGRLTAMRNEWERDASEHMNTFGQHLPASVECLVERFDAATQEGEG